MLSGSSCACFEITSCRIFKNPGFSLKDSGAGGNLDVIPMGTLGFVGLDGKRDKRWLSPETASFGKTYYMFIKQS